tara:strand:- start:1139 stop:1309 length:171 start_codon:yes stop_codon:yes gene_type:complete
METLTMTINEMIKVLSSGTISTLNDADKAQVMAFAFGDEFIKSSNKGQRVTYMGAI